MSFDPTKPSKEEGNFGQALDDTRANLNDLNSRVSAQENLSLANVKNEVVGARGSKSSIQGRLSVAVNDDGTLKFDSLKNMMWSATGDTPTYVSAFSFSVTGDKTTKYLTGMLLRLEHGADNKYGVVSTASYASGTDITTITLRSTVLTASLSSISIGLAALEREDPLIPRRFRVLPQPCWISYPVPGFPVLPNGTTFARSSPAGAVNRRGIYESVSTDSVRIQYDIETKGLLGWLLEGSIQNKCQNYNAAPTDLTGVIAVGGATVSVVTVASLPAAAKAAFDTSPLPGFVTAVYRVQCPGPGSGMQVTGPTGNTSTHTLSAFCYVVSGVPTLQLSGPNNAVSLSSDFERTTVKTTTPNSASDVMYFREPTGTSDFYVALNQLEQKPFATSPVVVAGSAVTRAIDSKVVATDSANGLVDSGDFSICVEAIAAKDISQSQFALSIEDGTANEAVWIYIADSNNELRMTVRNGGASAANITTGAVSATGKKFRAVAAVKDSDMRFTIAIEGVDLGNGAGVARTYSSASGAVPSGIDRIVFGNRSDLTFPFDGIVALAWGYDRQISQADAEDLISFTRG